MYVYMNTVLVENATVPILVSAAAATVGIATASVAIIN